MIENFRNWISALLCLGIFISIIELILPKSRLKKYIYVLIGIVTTITIISPGINLLKQDNIAQSVSTVINNFSQNVNINSDTDLEDAKKTQEKLVKDQFIESLKKDIESKLSVKGVAVTQIDVTLSANYDIEKISVKTNKLTGTNLNEVSKVVAYINSEYDVDYSKIEVIESGE